MGEKCMNINFNMQENDKNSFVVKPYMEDHENGKLTLVIKDHSFEEIKKYF